MTHEIEVRKRVSMVYDVLLISLNRRMDRHNHLWVRGIRARSLCEASQIAEGRHPNLGLTPTITSMAWPQWPQPKEQP